MQNAPKEHSAIFLTFIKLPIVFKTFVLSIFEWLLKTGFTVLCNHTTQIFDRRGIRIFLNPGPADFLWNFNQLVCRIKLIVMDFYTKLKTVDPDE